MDLGERGGPEGRKRGTINCSPFPPYAANHPPVNGNPLLREGVSTLQMARDVRGLGKFFSVLHGGVKTRTRKEAGRKGEQGQQLKLRSGPME